MIASALFNCGIAPNLVTKGLKLVKMAIPELGIQFLDSLQYMSGSLEYLAEYFKLPIRKGFLPYHMNRESSYNISKIPPLEVFLEDCHNKEKRKQIENWYRSRKNDNYSFKTELQLYCRSDTEILLLLVTIFLKQWYVLQKKMMTYFVNKADSEEKKAELEGAYFNPFGSSFCTLSSFTYALCRFYALNQHQICLVDDEKGKPLHFAIIKSLVYNICGLNQVSHH